MKHLLYTTFSLLFILGLNFSVIAQQQPENEFVTVSHSVDMDSYSGKVSDGFEIHTSDRGRATILSAPIAIPLQQERPFVALGMHWHAIVGNPHQIEVSARSSIDAQEWSEWMEIEHDHHVELDSDTYAANLVFFPAEAQFIQYQATVTPTMMFANPTINGIDLFFINPGKTPQSQLDDHLATVPEMRAPTDVIREKSANGVDFQVNTSAAYALPEYVDREDWGRTVGLTNFASRNITTVNHLIVHHSAGQNTAFDFAAIVRSYWNGHVNGNGWVDIGYNWLVDPNGVIYQGRAFSLSGNMDVVGAHFSAQNGGTMGICVIGNYSRVLPSEIAVNRVRDMLAWKANERNIDVLVRRVHPTQNRNIFTISGHRDGGSTECPGQMFYDTLPELRHRVNAYMNPPLIVSSSPNVSSSTPESAFIDVILDNKRAAVIGYVEYGVDSEQLTFASAEFQVDGSEEPIRLDVELTDLQMGREYFYRVVAINSDTLSVGETQSFTAGEPTSVDQDDQLPTTFTLEQNYPNPFNPTTQIQFSIPENAQVRVLVHNVQGQLLSVVADRNFATGRHVVSFDGISLSSGIYMYSLEVNGRIVDSNKMMMIK